MLLIILLGEIYTMAYHNEKWCRLVDWENDGLDKDYAMQLRVFEKQNHDADLTKEELQWKKKYNKKKVDNVTEEDGVKITRYKPNWM